MKKQIISILMAFVFILGTQNSFFIVSEAASATSTSIKAKYSMSKNLTGSSFNRWSSSVKSYITYNKNGGYNVVEVKYDSKKSSDYVTIEQYDKDNKLTGSKKLAMELPIFGAFYSGEKYNYIAYGQLNDEEDDKKEVIRIVKYKKNFTKVDSIAVSDCYTSQPFRSGCARFAENGDELILHTSRLRYTTPNDNLRHQSNLVIIVDTKSMTVKNELGTFQTEHVSHSFDQFVLYDDENVVLLDHGDAYPRSVYLQKHKKHIAEWDFDFVIGELEYIRTYDDKTIFDIPGVVGANCTGVTVGGFEAGLNNYIIAMNTIDHSKVTKYTSFVMEGLEVDQRNIIVCTLSKDFNDNTKVNQKRIKTYAGTDKIGSVPMLVKITDEKFILLWQEFKIDDSDYSKLKYIYLDGNGKPVGNIKTNSNFVLSECVPVVMGDCIVWYVNGYDKNWNVKRTLYSLPIE